MKRIVLAVVALVVVVVMGRAIWWWLASPETKVRYRLTEMTEGFNDSSASGVLSGLAKGFRDGSTGFDVDELHRILLSIFLRTRHPETGEFDIVAEIPEDYLVLVADDELSATVELDGAFRSKSRPEQAPCLIHFWITLKEDDEDGEWRVTESRFERISGRWPF